MCIRDSVYARRRQRTEVRALLGVVLDPLRGQLGLPGLRGQALAVRERIGRRKTQRELAIERFAEGGHPTPMPNPGVFARHNAVDVPARLPDGTGSPLSVSGILQARDVPESVSGRNGHR